MGVRPWRGFVWCVVLALFGLACWVRVAGASEASGGGVFGDPLVVSGDEVLVGGQAAAAEAAAASSPEAVGLREVSASKFEGMGAVEAGQLARESFPSAIAEVSGGLGQLPAGVSVVGYPSDYAASLDLGGGRHAVLQSLTPLAVGSGDARVPVEMALASAGSAFAPKVAAVGVRIPDALSEGPSLTGSGVSLTPVDEQGGPLGGESAGSVDGASVFYGNVATDTDVAVKPIGVGFDMQAVLRSARSPERLRFRIGGLPPGARLVQESAGGSVQVISDGETIARILPASARDAAGTRVPVSSVLTGDTLEVSVAHPAGAYQFPIDVDPAVGDFKLLGEGAASNWKVGSTNTSVFHFSEENERELVDSVNGAHNIYEWGDFAYKTQGSSRIYEFGSSTYGWSEAYEGPDTNLLYIGNGNKEFEEYLELPSNYNIVYYDLCPNATCSYISGSAGNVAVFEQYVKSSGYERFQGIIVEGRLSIYQETGPTAGFDTADASINGVPNAGSGQWVSPSATHAVLGVTATDPGIGVYKATVTSPQELPYINPYKTASEPLSGCSGVQCYMCWNWSWSCAGGVRPDGLPESSGVPLTFELETEEGGGWYTWLPDGEDSVTVNVENATGAKSTITKTVKIDSTAPTGIAVSGLPSGNEIGEGVYRLKAEATDGSGTTPSSGVGSLAVSIDGRQVGVPNGSCSVGPCKASGEWVLDGAEYGAGKHSLVVVATDGAGNRATQSFTLKVHHAAPVAIGPGSVDPQSGDFNVDATDVSIGGLSVTRSYDSRDVGGVEPGAVGAQWGVSLTGMERLTEQPDGSVVVTDDSGGTTSFAVGSSGFESPKGDSNLKLESVSKGYVLKNEASRTSTEFTQPEGSSYATPSFANSVGWLGASNGALKLPAAATVDSKGDLWAVDTANDRIEEYSEKNEFIKEIGTKGTGQGEFNSPYDIAFDSKGNFWVSDFFNNRVQKFNSAGQYIGQVGGKEGTGPGEFKDPEGIATDSKGDLFVVDIYNDRVQEFNEVGEYVRQFGAKGTGNGQFETPLGVATDSKGNVWVADTYNHRAQEFNEKGEYVRQFGAKGTGNGQFETPVGITVQNHNGEDEVWVGDYAENRIQAFNEKGEYLAQFGSQGTSAGQFEHPYFLSGGSRGTLWVADSGNDRIERWMHPTWVPTISEGVVATDKTTYAYVTSLVAGEPVTQPTEALAPVPAGVSCSGSISELKPGCKALSFNYATSTTATGEGRSEWGDYEGHLTRVYYTAYEPTGKAMKTVEVARYSYDKQGRPRAEWDPRASGELKTYYGYDSEGHLTSITPPGEESWAFTYGTSGGDTNTGRLVKVMRAGSTHALWGGETPAKSTGPTITGSPVAGVRLLVSKGTWTGNPLTYGYQWEDCKTIEINYGGKECSPIGGATNQNYTPVQSDAGQYLKAVVTATNGAGSVAASVTASAETTGVAKLAFSSQFGTTGSGNGQLNGPTAAAVDSKGNIWVVDSANARVQEFNSKGEYVTKVGSKGTGNGQFSEPYDMAFDAKGDFWVSDIYNNRVEEFNEKDEYVRQVGKPGENIQFKDPEGVAVDSKGDLWVVDVYDDRVVEFNESGVYQRQFGTKGTGNGQFELPVGVAVDSKGNVWVADTGNHRVQEFSETGTYKKQFGTLGTGSGQFETPAGVQVDSKGNVWVSDWADDRIQEFNENGEYLLQFGTKGTGTGQFEHPYFFGLDSKTTPWIADFTNNRVQHWTATTTTEGAAGSNSAGSTVEYNVPVTGAGKAYEMSAGEVGKWAQTDVPYEATGIFPPDEMQGWPATNYRRATVYYLDNKGRTVNVATPGGGISTSEYNETNDVVRTLTADNRVVALKEAKPEEAAKQLDTQSTYNSEGNELLSTLGPKHTVRLVHGRSKEDEEVQARTHTVYSYDEGAPSEGGPYRLVTKVTQTAKIEGEEKEYDPRTTTTSYSGQEGLGWTLRSPTSTVTDPSGLKLTRTTVYNKTTGQVVRSSTPGAAAMPVSFNATFGTSGTGNGQFKEPHGVAVSPSGNVYVADTANNRIEELTSTGEYIRSFGTSGTGNGQLKSPYGVAVDSKSNVWVADTGNHRIQEFNEKGEYQSQFGTEGTGNGQFKEPKGIAVNKGNIYVTDTIADRVQVFNEKGEYQSQFGSEGAGNGQLKSPFGITIAANGNVLVADSGNSRIDVFNEKHEYTAKFGSYGTGNEEFHEPKGVTLDPNGNIYVSDASNNRIQVFNPQYEYVGQYGKKGTGNGEYETAFGIASSTTGTIYVVDVKNARIQDYTPGNPHETETIYYTTTANPTYPSCGEHAEWAMLPCETLPVKQPETPSVPNLPITSITKYNMYGAVLTSTETVGSNTRTTINTYDEAGRLKTSHTTSTIGKTLPEVTDTYSTSTGALIEQSATTEGVTHTLKSTFNTLGQPETYTDADGNTTKYEYETENDDRLKHIDDGKGQQKYTYDETTGLVKELVDTQGTNTLTFTANYDTEGNLTSENYPNGMTANYTYGPAGETTGLNYIKTTNCTEKCTWYSDTVTPSIHGQEITQESTLASQTYSYDEAGRLTQTLENTGSEGCTTRIYANDEETNRTSLTTRPPGAAGACATEGGTVEKHTYDTANRLTDAGIVYQPLGETSKLPATDAGGSILENSFYADGQLYEQHQNGQNISYQLDPEGRTRETTDTGTIASTYTSHYTAPGDSPAWTIEPTSGHWTRYLDGIGGGLHAIETDTTEPVLQLQDLHGDIIARASISETATKLLSTERQTEYGVPTTTKPEKYSWLGADQRPTELPSGQIAMGARSYIPQLGRFLQTDPIPGGSANAYTYTYGDPINTTDPSGEFTEGLGQMEIEDSNIAGEEQMAKEQAAREEAERKALQEGAIDPTAKIMLSIHGANLLRRALTVGGPYLQYLLGLWVGGVEGSILAKIVEIGSKDVVAGLNACWNAYYYSDKPAKYRCGVTAEWWDLPTGGVIPISLAFEACYFDPKIKGRYACIPEYTITWKF